jgi:catechol 2,3-dioxygenase-like lactoylglutathione lyase family enzyme
MVADMDASLDFYTKRLGFDLKNKWEPRGRIKWCWLELTAFVYFSKALLMYQRKQNIQIE